MVDYFLPQQVRCWFDNIDIFEITVQVELWLNRVLCLDATSVHHLVSGTPPPGSCELWVFFKIINWEFWRIFSNCSHLCQFNFGLYYFLEINYFIFFNRYYVNRDTLFSFHKASEAFLQRLMSIYVAAHYKNTPNDLQMLSGMQQFLKWFSKQGHCITKCWNFCMCTNWGTLHFIKKNYVYTVNSVVIIRRLMLKNLETWYSSGIRKCDTWNTNPVLCRLSDHIDYNFVECLWFWIEFADAPAHHLYVLMGPVSEDQGHLPEILAVVQLCMEGELSSERMTDSMQRGKRAAGDLIPWTIAQQFQVRLITVNYSYTGLKICGNLFHQFFRKNFF